MVSKENIGGTLFSTIVVSLTRNNHLEGCPIQECGSPFEVSPRKTIKDKCSDCIAKARNKRKNEKRRSDPVNKFKEKLGQRVNYHLNETLNIPLEKEFHLVSWYDGLLKEDTSNISSEEEWIKKKNREFYQILEEMKKED